MLLAIAVKYEVLISTFIDGFKSDSSVGSEGQIHVFYFVLQYFFFGFSTIGYLYSFWKNQFLSKGLILISLWNLLQLGL